MGKVLRSMDHKAEIIRLAEEKSKALVERDVNALKDILHRDFRYTNSRGRTFDRDGYIALFNGHPSMVFKSQQYSNVSVAVHGDIAVFEADVEDLFLFEGDEEKGRYRTMLVYLMDGDGWKWYRGMTVESDPRVACQ